MKATVHDLLHLTLVRMAQKSLSYSNPVHQAKFDLYNKYFPLRHERTI